MKTILASVIIFFGFSIFAYSEPVDEMFEVMNMEEQMTGGAEAMLPLVDQMAVQFNLDNKGKEELKDIFRTWFNEDIDKSKIIREIKKVYKDTFTNSEMIKLVEFYQTPVGQKFIQKTPELMKIGAQLGMDESAVKQPELMARIEPFLERLNIK